MYVGMVGSLYAWRSTATTVRQKPSHSLSMTKRILMFLSTNQTTRIGLYLMQRRKSVYNLGGRNWEISDFFVMGREGP